MAGEGHPRGENGGGGPASPEGLARAKANLEPLAATKHGLSRFLSSAIAPPCRFCLVNGSCDRFRDGDATCIVAEEYQAQVTADLMALPQVQPEDEPLVREYSRWATAATILDRYIANASPLLPGADKYLDVQPALKERVKISSHLLKLSDALGLSPKARAALKLSEAGGAGNSWAAAVLEVDFTAEDANGIRSQPASGGDPVSGEGEGRAGDGGDG